MKTAVNIGLSNNPVPVEQIVNAFKIFFGRDVQWRVDDGGVWKGEGEETLVLLVSAWGGADRESVEDSFDALMINVCDILNQELIAYYIYDMSEGYLSFKDNHNKYGIEFNMKYFIEL